MPKKIKKNYGWICPKCGRVHAPHIDACPCSEHKDYWNQPIYPNYPNDYWIYPNTYPNVYPNAYPNDYLTQDPELKTTPSVIGPFVDNPNVIGPIIDDNSTADSQKAFQEIAKQTAWNMIKEISWGPLPKS